MLGRILEEDMYMLGIHGHPDYADVHVLGNTTNYLFASLCYITEEYRSPVFSAKYHVIRLHRNGMAVMSQAPAFVFLIIIWFHEG